MMTGEGSLLELHGETDGSDFPSMCMAGGHGTAVTRKGEHPASTYSALSAGTVEPTQMVPCSVQWHAVASATARPWQDAWWVL